MSWKSTRPAQAVGVGAPVLAIRCPRCRARFQRSGDRIPLYAVFPCTACGARLMRQQSLIVALEPRPDADDGSVRRAV